MDDGRVYVVTPEGQLICCSSSDGKEIWRKHFEKNFGGKKPKNDNGKGADSWGYSAFGELASHTGITSNPFLFNAQQFDGASGNYYLRARYYDPIIGRFISRDPALGIDTGPASFNPYT